MSKERERLVNDWENWYRASLDAITDAREHVNTHYGAEKSLVVMTQILGGIALLRDQLRFAAAEGSKDDVDCN